MGYADSYSKAAPGCMNIVDLCMDSGMYTVQY